MTWFSGFAACQPDSLSSWLYQGYGTLVRCLLDECLLVHWIRTIAQLGRYTKSELMARRISQLVLALLPCGAVLADGPVDQALKPCGEAYYYASQVQGLYFGMSIC